MNAEAISLVHPAGTVCKWCKIGNATTVVYDWPTCVTCAVSRRERVRAYLADMNPWNRRR